MDCFEDEVRALEAAAKSTDPARSAVAFYGSSSIRLWQSLSADLPRLNAINLGFGGSTLAACAHFFRRIVVPYRPSALVIYAGDNDLGDGGSPDQVLSSWNDLDAQIEPSLGGIPVVFLSIKPSPARWYINDQIRRTNFLVREAITQRPVGRFIDIYPLMLAPDGKPNINYYQPDGLHLSAQGYRIWTEAISAQSEYLLSFFTTNCTQSSSSGPSVTNV